MPKSKAEDESERRARKKLRKLEKKVEKYKNKLRRAEDSQGSESDESLKVTEIPEEPVVPEELVVLQDGPVVLMDPDQKLSEEFLEALGEPLEKEKRYGSSINTNILQRFENILIEGIKKEEKERILKNLSFPENGKLMEAPKLNLELIGLLPSAMRLRDRMLEERQEHTGYVVSSICQAIDLMSKPNFDIINIIKNLSDATRLLCYLHHTYTEIRRKMISPLLDKNLNLNLKENKRSEWLYTKLDDTVKSVSAMKKASSILAPPKKPKNWQPPRQPYHSQRGRGSIRGGYQQNPRYQARLPLRQNQQQFRRPAAAATSREATRGRARYP